MKFANECMEQFKRKSSFDQSPDQVTKKLRDDLITCIENFSNEIFYEIFDYLDGCHIYEAFTNLNYRFQQLLNSPSILFKINIDDSLAQEMSMNQYKPIILLNKQQIFSMELWLPGQGEEFFSSFIIDSMLSHLESFVVKWIDPHVVIPLLVSLTSLPRLFSLTIDTQDTGTSLNDIYQVIFALPTLKYNNFSTNGWKPSISLPTATNQQFSTIETLVIDHPCTFNEVASLITYTLQLRHLRIYHTIKTDPNIIRTITPITLSNLTSIHIHDMIFDELEIILSKKICCQLKVLSINADKDINFLDANRWKQLISQHLPYLTKFHLNYYEWIKNKHQYSAYSHEPNQFSSLFWIQRQCIYQADMNGDYIIHSIRPYKKKWYDKFINTSAQCYKADQLNTLFDNIKEIKPMHIKRVLSISYIYHLEIRTPKSFADKIIQIINLLPNLITLKIHSLLIHKPKDLSTKEYGKLYSTEIKNKISKVYLEKMNNIDEFDFLLALCPHMEYFQVKHINNMTVEMFLYNIIKKMNHDSNKHFCLLYSSVPAADDDMIKNLQEMINNKQLLINYTITRILDNIYLEWKRS